MVGIETKDGFDPYAGMPVADASLDNTSTNSVQNKVICDALSHVGMIVQSTTLDTEAKVKAIYGSHTSWSKIEGRVLVGDGTLDSTHTYTAGDVGGEPEHKLTVNEMPKHSHTSGAIRSA